MPAMRGAIVTESVCLTGVAGEDVHAFELVAISVAAVSIVAGLLSDTVPSGLVEALRLSTSSHISLFWNAPAVPAPTPE